MRKQVEMEIMNNEKVGDDEKTGGVEEMDADDDDGGDVVCSETDGGDMRRMRKMHNPRLPTKAEIEEHDLTHLPFRSWCRHCVRGRGQEEAHRKCEARDGEGVPEVHLDFVFQAATGRRG